MKFCFCIAEYNPFHNGHLKHIRFMKDELNAENIVVIMSGNFTQRGEPAILDKFTRARHAILAGADAVIELPTVFSTANAEVFAKGGVNIITSLNTDGGVCFGVESGVKQDYISLATALNNETKEYKRLLKEQLDKGVSLAKAKFIALKEYGQEFDQSLIGSPNNVLGVEYVKALLSKNSTLDVFPMIREGDHNDKTVKKGITSATSIRQAICENKKGKVKKCLPNYVFKDLPNSLPNIDNLLLYKALITPAKEMEKLPDCTEGLENRIKALLKDNVDVKSLIEKTTTKRYTSSRIRRILLSNLLDITKSFTDDCLSSPLYAKVLAVKKDNKNIISQLAQNSSVPLLMRKSDCIELKKTAKDCFEKDVLANDVYNQVTLSHTNEHQTILV